MVISQVYHGYVLIDDNTVHRTGATHMVPHTIIIMLLMPLKLSRLLNMAQM